MDHKQLHEILIESNIKINNAIQDAYTNLLNYYNNTIKDAAASESKDYIINELLEIIHDIEVSENYNTAFEKMNNLELELTPYTCEHSYVWNDKKVKASYIISNHQMLQVAKRYNNDADSFLTAFTKKIHDDKTSIDLNNIMFDVGNNIIYFDGNFKIYYTLTDDIIGEIVNFMLDDDAKNIRINDLLIHKTNHIILSNIDESKFIYCGPNGIF